MLHILKAFPLIIFIKLLYMSLASLARRISPILLLCRSSAGHKCMGPLLWYFDKHCSQSDGLFADTSIDKVMSLDPILSLEGLGLFLEAR